MVHRLNVFDVDEIFRHILSFLTVADDPEQDSDKPALYAAAQVNSRWATASLDALWSDISLQNLERFLGVTSKDAIILQEPPLLDTEGSEVSSGSCQTDQDQTSESQGPSSSRRGTESHSVNQCLAHASRFNDFYAPRVRRLRLDFLQSQWDVPSRLVKHLSSISSFNLSNLRTLEVQVVASTDRLELLKKFLPSAPSVPLPIKFTLEDVERPVCDHVTEVVALLRKMTGLISFSLPLGEFYTDYTDIFGVLCDSPVLEEVVLNADVLFPLLIIELAQNPALRRIDCAKNDLMGWGTDNIWPVMFGNRWSGGFAEIHLQVPTEVHNLHNLTHVAVPTDVRCAIALLERALNPSCLVSFGLTLVKRTTSPEILELTEVLASRFPNLRQFRLAPGDTVVEHPTLEWDSLCPLHACKAMEELEIFWHGPLVISNEDVGTLASSWPHLTTLLLRDCLAEDDWRAPPHPIDAPLSLECLVPLKAGCPLLQKLSLRLSLALPEAIASPVVPRRDKARLFPDMKIVIFDIALPIPPIEDARRIAAFLHAAFPTGADVLCTWFDTTLRGVQTYDALQLFMRRGEDGEEHPLIATLWKSLGAIIAELDAS